MTQKFTEDGTVIPVTKLLVKPCVITQIKNQKTDGYLALQISSGQKRKLAKPLKGHFKDLGNFRYSHEFRLIDDKQVENLKVGDQISLESFVPGDKVKATGTSKGRGFQGGVKRHGFHGQKASHGHKDQQRMPGSIGAGGVQHVLKGMRMAGQMGNAQITIKNLEVVEVDVENSCIYLKGAVPGANNGLVILSGDGELKIQEKSVAKPDEAQTEVKNPAEKPVENEPVDQKAETIETEIKPEEKKADEAKESESATVESKQEETKQNN